MALTCFFALPAACDEDEDEDEEETEDEREDEGEAGVVRGEATKRAAMLETAVLDLVVGRAALGERLTDLGRCLRPTREPDDSSSEELPEEESTELSSRLAAAEITSGRGLKGITGSKAVLPPPETFKNVVDDLTLLGLSSRGFDGPALSVVAGDGKRGLWIATFLDSVTLLAFTTPCGGEPAPRMGGGIEAAAWPGGGEAGANVVRGTEGPSPLEALSCWSPEDEEVAEARRTVRGSLPASLSSLRSGSDPDLLIGLMALCTSAPTEGILRWGLFGGATGGLGRG